MKIGVIVDNDFINDIRVRKEASILAAAGHQVFVLCYGAPKKQYRPVPQITIQRIRIREVSKKVLFTTINLLPLFDQFWKYHILRFIKQFSIDVLHVHDLYMAKSAHLAIRASQSPTLPLVLDLHENYPAAILTYGWANRGLRSLIIRPSRWTDKEGKYLEYADRIITLSEHYKETLLNRYPRLEAQDITAYPNVIDFERFESYPSTGEAIVERKFTLFYFGVVAKRRGIFDALEAAKEVIRQGLDIKLLIIGPVDNADRTAFESVLKEIPYSSHIQYIPWIDLSELVQYMNEVDICLAPLHVNPQHESGIANKIFQYMYGGKPIIASNCAPQRQIIEDYNIGLIYRDHSEFVKHIITLITQPEMRHDMGQRAKDTLYRQFHPDKIDRPLLEMYNKIEASLAEG